MIVGKTTMPDFGMLSSGRSSIHGTTRNPWRLDRNTAGSSSGAGAAPVDSSAIRSASPAMRNVLIDLAEHLPGF